MTSPQTLWVATHNQGKLQEFKELLAETGYLLRSQDELNLGEVEETGSTYEANAIIKAKALYEQVGGLVFADDSGLSVDCLDGAPGIYSARFAGKEADYKTKIDALWHFLAEYPTAKWTASFICALAFIDATGQIHTFRGETKGVILSQKRGEGGFGYDPIFYLPELQKTMAELPTEQKNRLSHRGKAVFQFKEHLNSLRNSHG